MSQARPTTTSLRGRRHVRPARGARTGSALLALLILLAACGQAPPASDDGPRAAHEAADGERPDLVLVVVDTLRADRLSTYGYHRPTSPRLDRLAASGAVFEDVTAQSSWTLPSMASLLSGRHVFVNAYRMPNGTPSLAERLRAAGYETFAFVGNANLGRDNGFARGFDHFVTRDDTGGETWDAFALEAAVRATLAQHPRGDAPRFLYLHLFDPHWPYDPRGEATLDGSPRLRDDTLKAWAAEVAADPTLRDDFDADRRSILDDLDAYDREVLNVDTVLARLLPDIAADERLVLLASDHGEVLWDRRHHERVVQRDLARTGASRSLREVFYRDHAYHMTRELLFTPLLAWGTGIPAGRRVQTPVENVDIAPTLLRAAGLPDDPELDGRALQDVLNGTAPEPRALYSHSNEGTLVRLTESGHQLVFPTDTGFSFGMSIALHHLPSDPYERRDVYELAVQGAGGAASDAPGVPDLDTLRTLMGLREQAVRDFTLYDDEPYDAASDDLRERMAELGYVGEAFEDR